VHSIKSSGELANSTYAANWDENGKCMAKKNEFELKPTVEDFVMLMGSILKPAGKNKYKKPKKEAIMNQIEGAPKKAKK
jgi:hypothetical protein